MASTIQPKKNGPIRVRHFKKLFHKPITSSPLSIFSLFFIDPSTVRIVHGFFKTTTLTLVYFSELTTQTFTPVLTLSFFPLFPLRRYVLLRGYKISLKQVPTPLVF